MLDDSDREKIITEAMSWIGTPYRHATRLKHVGVDCGQFVAAVYEASGVIPHQDIPKYVHDWHMHRSEERYLQKVEEVASKIDGIGGPGDIALFKYGRCISHGAIIIKWPQIIHSYIGLGVILDNIETNRDLKKRLVGCWSLRG